jgi:photosystem II stability/assembly factor-like uncharacterized protein
VTLKKKSAKTAEAKKSRKVSFSFRSTPVFKNDLEGIAITTFTDFNIWTGQRSSNTRILVTDDGGKSWLASKSKLPKKYCNSFVPEVSDRLLVSCNGSSGDFYESHDDGATWEHVRQQENF